MIVDDGHVYPHGCIYRHPYENGQWYEISTYNDGKLDGPIKYYFENRQLMLEGFYKDDKKEGLWKTYHANGQIWDEMTYKNDGWGR